MITFSRRTFGLRSAVVDGIYYGLIELDVDSETSVWLGARVGETNVRLGEPWSKVDDADDEARARELIAGHHQSLLAQTAPPKAAA